MNFNEYQEKALALALNSESVNGIPAWIYFAIGMAGEAGEALEKIKKAIRDDGAKMTDERRAATLKELGDVLWYITAEAKELGSSLEEVANINLSKLYDRKERGVLRGSGDNR